MRAAAILALALVLLAGASLGVGVAGLDGARWRFWRRTASPSSASESTWRAGSDSIPRR